MATWQLGRVYWSTGNYYILNSENNFNVAIMYRRIDLLPEF